jgi:uncharacterized protein YoxC
LIWVGHGSVTSTVSSISSEIDGWLVKADQRLDDLTTSINTVSTRVDELSAEAQELAQDDADRRLVAAFVTKVDNLLSPIVTDAREAIGAVRERAAAFNDALRLAARLLPVLGVPELQGDRLEGIRDRFDRLEETLLEIRDFAAGVDQAVDDILQRVSNGLAGIADQIDEISQAVESVNEQVLNAQAAVAKTESDILSWILWISLGLTLLTLWQILLHASLFIHGLGWFKKQKAAEGPATGDQLPATGDQVPPPTDQLPATPSG